MGRHWMAAVTADQQRKIGPFAARHQATALWATHRQFNTCSHLMDWTGMPSVHRRCLVLFASGPRIDVTYQPTATSEARIIAFADVHGPPAELLAIPFDVLRYKLGGGVCDPWRPELHRY